MQTFSTRFTAWVFLAAMAMLWGGWMAIPVDLGPYVTVEDFAVIEDHRITFVWAYRCYFFGAVLSVMAVVGLSALVLPSPSRVMIWPGAAVMAGGSFAFAIGSAFYYHHGYWGSLDVVGKPIEDAIAYVEAIRYDTKFVTCFVRFGRLFAGLGLLVLNLGVLRWRLMPAWIGVLGAVTGLAAVVVVMASADAFWVYAPVFHLTALWMAAFGVVLLRRGLAMGASAETSGASARAERG